MKCSPCNTSDELIWETCELGHINNHQCHNFMSHVHILQNIGEIDSLFLNEKEKEYIRGLRDET